MNRDEAKDRAYKAVMELWDLTSYKTHPKERKRLREIMTELEDI